MEGEASFSHITLPIFDGENYDLWEVKMQSYMESLDLWDAVEEDYEIYPLPENPTMAQIKNHKERKMKKAKARSCLFTGVSQMIFIRIMTLKSPKAIWDYLKEEYAGDDRIRSMQVLNLRREFELQRMKESETIKEYSNKLLGIANKIKLLGSDFADSRIVEKILVTVPERYEASIASLENTKDLSKITLAEVLHALQAQEQRRLMRQDRVVEGALPAKHHEVDESKKDFFKKNQPASSENSANNQNKGKDKKKNYPPCHHCGKKGHAPFRCWRRPDAKCNKCNQIGHEAVICPNKNHHDEGAQIANQEEEDQLFVATCFLSSESSESWLIDSGCTNHMTYDKTLFKDLKPTNVSKVRIGNGGYIPVKGKGTVAISTCSGIKLISDVLYVPNIDQNLLSVGQLIKKGFKVSFEHQHCFIYDNFGREVLRVKMKGKSFSFDPAEEEHTTYFTQVTPTELWHKRLDHCHLERMLNMKKRKYAKENLKKFQMEECKSVSTPMNQKEKFSKEEGVDNIDEGYYGSLIGCLMYLTTTRPNILFAQKNKTGIFVDNQVAIAIANNPVCHGKTKHFNIKFYYLIKMQQSGEVNLIYCKSKDQLADMFTKSLPINKLELKELEFAVPKARRSVEDILL